MDRKNAASPCKLDFSRLPELDEGHMWFQMGQALRERLCVFSEMAARAECAVSFAVMPLTHLTSDGSKYERMKEACFRAALSEFASMEDMLANDLRLQGNPDEPFKCYQSENPLLHIMRMLRNLHIHISPLRLCENKREVLWGDPNKPEDAYKFEMLLWMIDGITVEALQSLRNVNRYSEEQMIRIVEWFNWAQGRWGISELILLSVEAYCTEVVDRHLPHEAT